ncbi:MAG: response regulator [Syntrophobacter sp.]
MPRTSLLLIDDERSFLEGLELFLEDEGYEVHLSRNGDEALTVFQEISPALVVTDLRMPGLSGIEVIRRMKDLKRDTLIIILTGHASLQSAVEAIRLDVFDFLSKPIDLDQFKSVLDRARENIQRARRAERERRCIRDQLAHARHHLELHKEDMEMQKMFATAGQLMPAMLHNLNNRLTLIVGETQMLKAIHPEMNAVERIDRHACFMSQIIRSFLRKVKPSTSRQETILNLNQILVEEVSFLESHPNFNRGMEKEWRLADSLPPVEGVAADFAQVFENLLFNAAEAMQEQAVKKLFLATLYSDSELRVVIGDNGPGIPAEIREHLFEPFFSTKTRNRGVSGGIGTGLGLYSCRQILREYGADIEVVSSPGQGARFEISIPRHS